MTGKALTAPARCGVSRDLPVNTWHTTQPGRLMGLTAWQWSGQGSESVIAPGQVWTWTAAHSRSQSHLVILAIPPVVHPGYEYPSPRCDRIPR